MTGPARVPPFRARVLASLLSGAAVEHEMRRGRRRLLRRLPGWWNGCPSRAEAPARVPSSTLSLRLAERLRAPQPDAPLG